MSNKIISDLQVKIVQQLIENSPADLIITPEKLGLTSKQHPLLLAALDELSRIFGGQLEVRSEPDAPQAAPQTAFRATLSSPNILLDKKVIQQQMTTAAQDLFTKCQICLSTDSTNKTIKTMPAGSILLAEQQTSGRGRYGRTWLSPFAAGIYLSLFLQRDQFSKGVAGLSLAIGVMLVRFLRELHIPANSPNNPNSTKHLGLKWPNDLLISINPICKLGGVLVELSENDVIIGIGINYSYSGEDKLDNKLDPAAEKPAEKQIAAVASLMDPDTAKSMNRSLATAMLINQLTNGLHQFFAQGFSSFDAEWNALNLMADLPLAVDTGQETLRGICRGVDSSGCLLLSNEQTGDLIPINSGTVLLDT
ncbi:MAG: biotin--[acetyl-CoA-carboxylase] ligase [Gammaproteobacteria bacterium]|nr:biotin--[acetyl-CoA-carboxylase] ligase [Gammaproteobacteria bacterium]